MPTVNRFEMNTAATIAVGRAQPCEYEIVSQKRSDNANRSRENIVLKRDAIG